MKRWDIHAPSQSQYSEEPEGEWVEYGEVEPLIAELERRTAWSDEQLGKLVAELETLKAVHQDAQAELVKYRDSLVEAGKLWVMWLDIVEKVPDEGIQAAVDEHVARVKLWIDTLPK